MKLRNLVLVILLRCVLCAPGQVFAAEAPDSVAMAAHLDEVTVSADHRRDEVIKPQVLGGGELARLSANSVADAARYFAGVQLKDYGGVGGIKTLDIRSMGSNHMGVFYDGLPLGNAQNGQIDLGRFSLDNIEEIALYNCQKSTIFQPARDFASAGSVYIRSRRPRFAEGRRYAAGATVRTGSFGLINPSVRLDLKLTERTSLTVSGEYLHATGRYRFRYRKVLPSGATAWDTTATRHNGDVGSLRLEAGLFGSADGSSWMAKAYFYDSERGIPGAIVNNVWRNSQRQWDRDIFAQGRYRKALGDRFEVMGNARYAGYRMRYLNPDTTLMHIDNTFVQHETYLSAAARWSPTGWWDVTAAADWQFNALRGNMALFAFPLRHQLLTSVATALNPGHFHLRGSLLLTEVWDRTRPEGRPGSSRHIRRLTPAVFGAWIPSAPWLPEVRAFWKRSFRMPTFNDLYYTDIGNATLRPETVTQLNAGTTWRLGATLELSADVYHNIVTDKIIAVPKGTGQYRWMMMNIGHVRINGLDLTATASHRFGHAVTARLRLAYTLQSAIDRETGGQIPYIPRHSGSAVASVEWRGAAISYSWIYAGERWDSSANIPANHVEPWYTSDLSLTWPFAIGASTLRLTVEINNLADQQYEVIRNYPMPGRNFKLTASCTI